LFVATRNVAKILWCLWRNVNAFNTVEAVDP
jgi:hypothetical protein